MSMGHFLHFLIPRIVRLGLNLLSNGSFALQSKAFRLFGCLKATIGGLGNISNIFPAFTGVTRLQFIPSTEQEPSKYLYECSTSRYVRLNGLNVLHVHGPYFFAP